MRQNPFSGLGCRLPKGPTPKKTKNLVNIRCRKSLMRGWKPPKQSLWNLAYRQISMTSIIRAIIWGDRWRIGRVWVKCFHFPLVVLITFSQYTVRVYRIDANVSASFIKNAVIQPCVQTSRLRRKAAFLVKKNPVVVHSRKPSPLKVSLSSMMARHATAKETCVTVSWFRCLNDYQQLSSYISN